MGPVVALAAVLVVLVVAAIARVVRRRNRDEIRSIHHYHDRLDTLHVEQHDRGGSVKVVDLEAAPVVAVDPHRPRLDPDAAHLDTAARPAASTGDAPRDGRHDRQWAIGRMEPRARVDTTTTVVVAIVVVAVVVLALVGFLIQRGRGATPPATTTHTTTTHAVAAPSKPAPTQKPDHLGVVPGEGERAPRAGWATGVARAGARASSTASSHALSGERLEPRREVPELRWL